MSRNKYFYITAIAAFILLSGMSCEDNKLERKLERKEAEIQRAVRRAETAEAERRKEAARARAEKKELKARMLANNASKDWSNTCAFIICAGFTVAVIIIWKLKSRRAGKEVMYEES